VNGINVANLAHARIAFAAFANMLLMADTLGYNKIIDCLTIEFLTEIPS
jgi:hypothetical protein